MALKFSRLAVSCFPTARKLAYRRPSLVYNFAKFKKPETVFLAFLGISLGTSEDENDHKEMTDMKAKLENADQLFDDNKFPETVDFLKTLDQDDPEVLWRMGRAMFKASGTESNSSKKATMIRQAFRLIAESLDKKEENFAVHKWYAILLDAKSNLDGMKERVTQLENVKKHMQRAIELNPEDPTSRYILGEFSYGLADLPWYQRKVVSTIFATPPTGTYEEALESFLKAESLEPDFYSMNKLMIGKCYYQLKNYEKAKEYLTKAFSVPVQNEDDRKCKEEAETLLKKVK